MHQYIHTCSSIHTILVSENVGLCFEYIILISKTSKSAEYLRIGIVFLNTSFYIVSIQIHHFILSTFKYIIIVNI